MIEQALKNEGLRLGRAYQVFYKEKDFDEIDWTDDCSKIIKLHGSIEDKSDIAITLNQVANKVHSVSRQRVINHVFSEGDHKIVLVLGYSCSDAFDISPQIQAISKNHKKVLFVEHYRTSDNQHKKSGEIEDIGFKRNKNPFQNFYGSKRIFYNTDDLVKEIWNFCIEQDYFFIKPNKNPTWKQHVHDWDLELQKKEQIPINFAVLGTIFHKISYFETSLKYWEQIYTIAKSNGNKGWQHHSLDNIAINCGHLGQYHRARMSYHEALQIAKERGDKVNEGKYLGGLGVVSFNMGEYKIAMKYHKKALQISNIFGNDKLSAGHLSNIGATYRNMGKYRKAIKYLQLALEKTRIVGDKEGEGIYFSNLGRIYASLGKYTEALEYHQKSLDIADTLGDKKGKGVEFGNIGYAILRIGDDYYSAIHYLKQSLAIAKEVQDEHGAASDHANLGSAFFEIDEYQKAANHLQQALDIFRSILGDEHQYTKDVKKRFTFVREKLTKQLKKAYLDGIEGLGYAEFVTSGWNYRGIIILKEEAAKMWLNKSEESRAYIFAGSLFCGAKKEKNGTFPVDITSAQIGKEGQLTIHFYRND